jgi:hypothetical protein
MWLIVLGHHVVLTYFGKVFQRLQRRLFDSLLIPRNAGFGMADAKVEGKTKVAHEGVPADKHDGRDPF